MGNFIALMLTVYLGGIQFGIIISMWNVAWKPFAFQNNVSDDIKGEANHDITQGSVFLPAYLV